MKLIPKLALALSLLMTALLCATLGLAYRAQSRLFWEYSGALSASAHGSGAGEALAQLRGETDKRLFQAALVGSGVGILLSMALAFFLVYPLGRISEAADRAAQGDFGYRIGSPRSDELGALAGNVDRMMERLAEMERLKGEFLSKVSHDLKNPLNAVLSKADLLAEGVKGPLNAGQREAVLAITRSGLALAGMIDKMLELTRLESGRRKLEPAETEVASMLDSVLESAVPTALELGVRTAHDIQEGAETAFADPDALQRVLDELVLNALKFTPSGGEVRVRASRDSRGVVFSVSDTGVGIPPERLGGLFTRFYQVPETRNKVRPSTGSGLGLALCRLLVEAHGGKIWADSVLFRGSTFSFLLPYSTNR